VPPPAGSPRRQQRLRETFNARHIGRAFAHAHAQRKARCAQRDRRALQGAARRQLVHRIACGGHEPETLSARKPRQHAAGRVHLKEDAAPVLLRAKGGGADAERLTHRARA